MAIVYLIIVLSASIFWMLLLSRVDRFSRDKGHKRIILAAFIMGCFSWIVTDWFYAIHPLNQGSGSIGPLYHLTVVGPVEELAKFLMFILLVCVRGSIKEPQDGMLQGAAVGLGFSAVENFFFAFTVDIEVLVLRTIICSVGHMVYASFWGYAWGAATYASLRNDKKPSYEYVALAFIPSAIVHGMYNSILVIGNGRDGLVLGVMFDMLLLVISLKAFQALAETSPYCSFPYYQASKAIKTVRRGLKLNPRSIVLQRRLALYCLSAGRYKEAHHLLGACIAHIRKHSAYRVFDGIALLGLGKRKEGEEAIKQGWGKLKPRQQLHLKIELRRLIRSKKLYENAMAIIERRTFVPNPYPARRFKFGHADYWKADSRLLAEKMEELRHLLRMKKTAPIT